MRSSPPCAVSLAFVAMLGCGRDEADPQGEAVSLLPVLGAHGFDPEAHSEDPVAAIELLDAGTEPREQLRYADRASRRTLEITTTVSFGEDTPFEGPMLDLRFAWTCLAPEGERHRWLFETAEVVGGWGLEGPGTMQIPLAQRNAQALRAAFERVAGQATGTSMGVEEVVQTRGIDTQPDFAAQLEIFAVPLPREAIGIGATWTRSVHDDEWNDVGRYTLAERNGDSLAIDYSRTVVATNAAEGSGTTMSGRFEVSLSDSMARSGTIELIEKVAFPQRDDPPPDAEFRQTIALRTVSP